MNQENWDFDDTSLDFHATNDEPIHSEEKWLVSYADMMTLLFGLFVLLYSTANKFETVQKAAREQFKKDSAPEVDVKKTLIDYQLQTRRLAEAESELAHLRAEKSANVQAAQDFSVKIRERDNEILELKNHLAAASAKVTAALAKASAAEAAATTAKAPAPAIKAAKVPDLSDQLRVLNDKIAAQTRQLESEKGHSAELEEQIKKLSSAQANVPFFMAIIMTWSTQDHDVDMIVSDPNGRTFDFKRRQFNGNAGQFVLDTRRGPGAEMWQTDKLVAGRYKIRYVFYNTYGNDSPAVVHSTIYSTSGAVNLPSVNLDFKSRKEQVYEISVSQKGEISLVH